MRRLFLTALLLAALPLVAQDATTLDGEPALRFMVVHAHLTTACEGVLWITPTRVRYESASEPTHAFDHPRAQITGFHAAHSIGLDYVKIEAAGHSYRMGVYPDLHHEFGDRMQFLEKSYTDFTVAHAEVDRIQARRSVPEVVKAGASNSGVALRFPVILAQGVVVFRAHKGATVWADPTGGDASAYGYFEGMAARGILEVTADRVRFVDAASGGAGLLAFDTAKSDFRVLAGAGGYPYLFANTGKAGNATIMFTDPASTSFEPTGRHSLVGVTLYEVTPILRSLGSGFPQMAADLLPKPVLVVSAERPGAEIFVDEQDLGVTAADGTLRMTALSAGEHTLRATQKNYYPWSGKVTLVSGEEKRVEAKLAALPPPEPPKPAAPSTLSREDVVKMLEGGVSSQRVGNLVRQNGVGFALDEIAERQIRAAGGDAELLLLISRSKR